MFTFQEEFGLRHVKETLREAKAERKRAEREIGEEMRGRDKERDGMTQKGRKSAKTRQNELSFVLISVENHLGTPKGKIFDSKNSENFLLV